MNKAKLRHRYGPGALTSIQGHLTKASRKRIHPKLYDALVSLILGAVFILAAFLFAS